MDHKEITSAGKEQTDTPSPVSTETNTSISINNESLLSSSQALRRTASPQSSGSHASAVEELTITVVPQGSGSHAPTVEELTITVVPQSSGSHAPAVEEKKCARERSRDDDGRHLIIDEESSEDSDREVSPPRDSKREKLPEKKFENHLEGYLGEDNGDPPSDNNQPQEKKYSYSEPEMHSKPKKADDSIQVDPDIFKKHRSKATLELRAKRRQALREQIARTAATNASNPATSSIQDKVKKFEAEIRDLKIDPLGLFSQQLDAKQVKTKAKLHFSAACDYLRLNKPVDAIIHLRQCKQLNYLAAAHSETFEKRLPKLFKWAITQLRKLGINATTDLERSYYYYYLGAALSERNEIKEALECFRASYKISPDEKTTRALALLDEPKNNQPQSTTPSMPFKI